MALDNFENFIDRVESFDAAEELFTIVDSNKYELEKLMRAQLAQGIDNTGQPRIDQYTEPYAALKPKKYTGLGAVTDRVTFYATGDLYEDLEAEVNPEGFIVESQLPTFDYMSERIGFGQYGLAPEGCLQFATEVTLPAIIDSVETKMIG